MTPADLPIWAMLTPPSLDALLLGRDQVMPRAITLASDLDGSSAADAPLLTTTRLMIQRAQAIDGLTLTATGALSRVDVRALFEAMSWPGYDKANALAMNKVLNEADVLPVELTRLSAQAAKLLRKREKRLLATKSGSALVATAWNYAYNLGFDRVMQRLAGHTRKSLVQRVAHAVLFEAALLMILLPPIAVYLGIRLVDAFLMDLAIAAFYVAYAFVFNLAYDWTFPLPSWADAAAEPSV